MSVSDTVHVTLRRRLMAGYYDPGTQMKEEAVAADLGVSRTPVRAAIQRLISEGLLTPAPKRGAIVTQWRVEDAEEVFNLRIMLESHGAALAARNIDQNGLDGLRRLNDAMAKAATERAEGYLDAIHRLNHEFHQQILVASGSAYLRNFGFTLLDFPLVIGGFYVYDEDDIRESIRQHGEILSAMTARNADWAKAAFTCHLAAAIERFRRSREAMSRPAEGRPISADR